MFLSLKEIFYYKTRYTLIATIIFLVSYVVFILSGLSTGLANQFKQAVVDWNAEKIVLSDSSNNILSASQISKAELDNIEGKELSPVSIFSTSINQGEDERENITVMALPVGSNILPSVKDGADFSEDKKEIVIPENLADKGYKVGDKIKVGNNDTELKIVGIAKPTYYSATPVVYGSFTTLSAIKNMNAAAADGSVNGVIVKSGQVTLKGSSSDKLKVITTSELINNIPGYSAQKTTLSAMIYFLFLIVLLIIAVFMYVITLQKVPIFGIMKAQGISNFLIMKSILWQSFWLALVGVVVAFGGGYLTSFVLPQAMPFAIDFSIWTIYGFVLIIVSILGSVFSLYTIRKIDPTQAIGG
ncbi:ABC transporter permease [Lactococcus ileimucosae]|uniref:ABC transporter permease n=1 Tax=Lactococcus ileimucosae TaxID=2941329 RepID=UPI003513542F